MGPRLLLLQLLPTVLAAAPAVHLRRQHHVVRLEVLAALTGEGDEGVPAVPEEAPQLALGQGLASLVLGLLGDAGGIAVQAEGLPGVAEDLTEVLLGETVEGHLELFLACFHCLAPFRLGEWDRPLGFGEKQKPESGSWFLLPPMTWGTPPP